MSSEGEASATMSNWDHVVGYLNSAPGPLAWSVRDCTEFFKIQTPSNMHHIDPLMAPTPLNQQMYDEALPHHSDQKVKVGFIKEMSFLPVSPSVKRAMDIAKKGLEDAGYEIVDFELTQDDY